MLNIFLFILAVILLGFYFIRTGISFMENNQGNKPPDNLEDNEESDNPEEN